MKKQRDLGDVIAEFQTRLNAVMSPLRKLEQAGVLMREAEAEMAQLFGPARKKPAKTPAKKKPVIEISYKAPVVDVGDDDVSGNATGILLRVFKGSMKFDDIRKKAKLSSARTREILHTLRDRNQASLEGKGRNSVWVRR